MSYCDGDNTLDGHKVADWIEERAEVPLDPSLARRLYEWRRVGRAPLVSVDRILTARGFHVTELPDEFWIADPRHCEICGTDIGLHNLNATTCDEHKPRSLRARAPQRVQIAASAAA